MPAKNERPTDHTNVRDNSKRDNSKRDNSKRDDSTSDDAERTTDFPEHLSPEHPVYGKLFPVWIPNAFRRFKLDKFDMSVECGEDAKTESKELALYQQFLSQYLAYDSPNRNLLLYHGVGRGKTPAVINYLLQLHRHNPNWQIILLIKASLQRTWEIQLREWLPPDQYDLIRRNLTMINYDGPTASNVFLNRAMRDMDNTKKFMYIIEEAHNFIGNVFGNIQSETDGGAKRIYDFILNHCREKESVRVLCMTATPIVNHPYEFALIANLLRPDTFPLRLDEFNETFVSSTIPPTIRPEKVNQFSRRILDLVDYYEGAHPKMFAKKEFFTIDVPMGEYQYSIYRPAEEEEDREGGGGGGASVRSGRQNKTSFKSATRTASNFVFPNIDEVVRGDRRPKMGKFKWSDSENQKFLRGKLDKLDQSKINAATLYNSECQHFLERTYRFFIEINEKDKPNQTLLDDLKTFRESDLSFLDFHKKLGTEGGPRSRLYRQLYECSPKMTAALHYIARSRGKTIFYSSFVSMEGIGAFCLYLRLGGIRFYEYHGGIPTKDRNRFLQEFNDESNSRGTERKVMCIGPAGTEGLNFTNIRQIHILEPYWNETLIEQIIGRGVRHCSHSKLPALERTVQIYKYRCLRPLGGRMTTDMSIYNLSRDKQNLVESFLNVIRGASVTCELNKNHHPNQGRFKCFKQDSTIVLNSHPGPAFKKNFTDDAKFDRGAGARGTRRRRIQVRKVKAIHHTMAEPFDALIDPATGFLYDQNFDLILGKARTVVSTKGGSTAAAEFESGGESVAASAPTNDAKLPGGKINFELTNEGYYILDASMPFIEKQLR